MLCTNTLFLCIYTFYMMFKDIQLLMIPNSADPFKFDGIFPWEDSPCSRLELVTATESGKQHVESVSTSV